jgi:hypothetical protein
MISRATKQATPRYVYWPFFGPALSSTVLTKKIPEERRGATKVPTPYTGCPRFRRISLYFGGPHIERKG